MIDGARISERYNNAEKFEHEMCSKSMVINSQIFPHWIPGEDCFWYIRKVRNVLSNPEKIDKEFRLVNAESGSNKLAFDHSMLGASLAHAAATSVDPYDLPITNVTISLVPYRVRFSAFRKDWLFDPADKSCKPLKARAIELVSPDGMKSVFIRDFNLWVRNLISGDEIALTADGEKHFGYAVLPERVNLVEGLNNPSWVNAMVPEALWSPDSQQVFVVKVDERKVLSMPITKYVPTDGSVRPSSIQVKYALPGDPHVAEYQLLTIDVNSGETCFAEYPPLLDTVLFAGLFSGNRAWWGKDSRRAYFLDMGRGQKEVKVVSLDTRTGETELLFTENSETYIDLNLDFEQPACLLPLAESNELIWFSERSGWGHLYLYDLVTGRLKNSITEGSWLVREILYYDQDARELLIQTAGRVHGRNPYYRDICRVNIDSGILTTLVSTDHDYHIWKPSFMSLNAPVMFGQASKDCFGVSESGKYIVVSQQRADLPTCTKLINKDGNILREIEVADMSGLPDDWQRPEPVQLLAADGETDIYGLVFRPSGFSANKKYPIINWVHNNPFYNIVPMGLYAFPYTLAQAYSELGTVVVMINGRGSCQRSKAFHDEAYGRVHAGSSLSDQVAGLHQLAERHPYLDLDRVGIVDSCGSNAPVFGLLAYPDVYKAGTVCSTWDVRLTTQGETYQGLLGKSDYNQSVLGNMAANLKGKLLLMHGVLDPFFHVGGVFQLVDSFAKANKDIDLVLLPNGGHTFDSCSYSLRRSWDYITRHLCGDEPPLDRKLSNGFEFAQQKRELELNCVYEK